jgi:RHS repeat-associated protein
MNVRHFMLSGIFAMLTALPAAAQAPILSSVEAPYADLQGTIHIAGSVYGSGAVAYGPAGTPLVLSGSNLGAPATAQFIGYKNGVVDPNTTVTATVTPWSSTMLYVTIPAGAVSGLLKVTIGGRTSNGLPIMVTPGTYADSCPAFPSTDQLQITSSALSNGAVGRPYSVTLSVTGGTGPYTWSIASGTLPSGLALNSSTGTISGTPTAVTPAVSFTVQVTDSSSPHKSDQAVLSLTIDSVTLTASTVYSYVASYDGVGNVVSHSDSTYNGGSIMGAWNFSYDTLNRLKTGGATSGAFSGQNLCWSYDSFGNRTAESLQLDSCPAQESGVTATAGYNTHNQITWTTVKSAINGYIYDAAGNDTCDSWAVNGAGQTVCAGNQYLYDAEGRVCAVAGPSGMTGYLYNADGARVAKGAISSMNCDPTASGFQLTESYVLGQGGEQLTMLDGSGNWQRTNVYGAGKLLGTYDLVTCTGSLGSGQTCTPGAQVPALHFHLEDPLGTRRMQVSGYLATLGQPETDIQSLPFGNGLNPYSDPSAPSSANDATPLHFTGKERDSESGNDYFGARYFGSSMGRFMSPDPSGLLAQHPENPQSWNLYAYALNNPLKNIDPTGLDCVYANDAGNGIESIDHNSNSGECGSNGGTWAPGYVDENWAHFNQNTNMFQVGSVDGAGSSATVDYTNFQSGAQTDANGNCLSGCGGYGFASANADWLQGQLVGNSQLSGLDGYIQFLTGREQQLSSFSQFAFGPLDPSKNNWAGPGGMGPPQGTGDWRASMHDYNFNTNGITIGSYFNPSLSPATSRALIQSNGYLMQTGGFQGAKEKLFFGVVNAFQWASHIF